MVTGHAPFTGDTPKEVMSAILEKEPPPLTSYNKHTPAELQQIISKTLRKDREERYHSAHELLEALKDLRHKLEVEADLARAPAAPSMAALDTIARCSGARIVNRLLWRWHFLSTGTGTCRRARHPRKASPCFHSSILARQKIRNISAMA